MSDVIGLYNAVAKSYDRDRNRSLIELSCLQLVEARLADEGACVLDVGCGAGEPVARYFIDRNYRIIGLDAAENMIALCRTRFPDHRWIVGDMRTMNIAGDFSAIIAWDSFFHLPPDDQRPMFKRFAAHLTAGGALLFTSGHEAGTAWGKVAGRKVYHASLDPAEYRDLLSAAGFTVSQYREQDKDCGGHTVWLARKNIN